MYVENGVATKERLSLYYYFIIIIIAIIIIAPVSIHVVKVENEYITNRNFCRLDQYSLDLPKVNLYSHLM